MKILVTGGSGFIGSHLTLRLLSQGHELISVTSSTRRSIHPKIEVHGLDLTKPEAVKELSSLLDHCDLGYFMAARKPPANDIFGQNTLMDMHSAKAFKNSSCSKAIYVSGITVFPQRSELVVTEQTEPAPGSNPYFNAKLIGEHYFEAVSERGKKVSIIRINAPYGPGMPKEHVISTFISLALAGKSITVHGTGRRMQYFTWVGDVARALGFAATMNSGVYHFCGPEYISIRSLSQNCLLACKASTPIVYKKNSEGFDCPIIGQDRFESIWPRAQRVPISKGLSALVKAIRDEHYPTMDLYY